MSESFCGRCGNVIIGTVAKHPETDVPMHPGCVPNPPLRVPMHARIIECVPEGRLIVTRLPSTILIEKMYRGGLIRIAEIAHEDAVALSLALDELAE